MSTRRWSMQDVPRAGRWAIYIALAVLFAIACAFLANWQFDRNEERSAQLALVERNYDAEPVPLSGLIAGTDDFDSGDEWRPVEVTGRYIAEEQVLVRNRAHNGTSAFEVLTPFELEDGRVLVIDRGWLPPGAQGGEVPDAVPAVPEGELTVLARLRPGEPLPNSGRGAPEGQVPTIHLPLIADAVGDQTITSAYGRMISEDPPAAERGNEIASPSEDPGPHLSYAIQWILFAVMGFVFIAYFIRTERMHKRLDEEDAEGDEDGEAPVPRPRRKRRDSDADAEDAILEGR